MNDYGITYNDMSYITYTLSDLQYSQIKKALIHSWSCVDVDDLGILILTDVRSIVKQKPLPLENESYTPDLDEDEKEHIKMLKWAEAMALEVADETEYEGGMRP